jgi:hypothetical protein
MGGFGVVPRLQNQVLSIPAIAQNEWLSGFLKHPAGPFTSEPSLARRGRRGERGNERGRTVFVNQ